MPKETTASERQAALAALYDRYGVAFLLVSRAGGL